MDGTIQCLETGATLSIRQAPAEQKELRRDLGVQKSGRLPEPVDAVHSIIVGILRYRFPVASAEYARSSQRLLPS